MCPSAVCSLFKENTLEDTYEIQIPAEFIAAYISLYQCNNLTSICSAINRRAKPVRWTVP
jgi:hypothetical protein